MATKYQSYDEQDPTLFDVHLELSSLPIPAITEELADSEDASRETAFAAGSPCEALDLLIAQAQHYRDEIESGDLSPHAKAVTAAKATQRLSGTLAAVKAVAVTAACVTADEQLEDPDVEFGAYRPHADRIEGNDGDHWITRGTATAVAIGAALKMPPGSARNLVDRSNRLVQHLPHAFARLASGDWSDWDLKVALDALKPLTDEQATDADQDLHSKPGSRAPQSIRQRINRWITKKGLQPVDDANEKTGIQNRRVEFSAPDECGMRWMHLFLPSTDITAIATAISDFARHAPEDDPRTSDQVRADVVRTMLFGPAALTAEASVQLEFEPVGYDDTNTPLAREREQYEQAQDAWAAILLLMSTLGMTVPAPPRAVLNVDVPLSVLLQLRAGMMPGTGPHAPPEGECPTCGHKTSGADDDLPHQGLDGHSGAGAPSLLLALSSCRNDQREDAIDVPESTPSPAHDGLDGHSGAGAPSLLDQQNCPDSGCSDAGWDTDARGFVHGLGRIGWRELGRLLDGSPDLRRVVTDDLTGAPVDIGATIKDPPAAMRQRVQHRDKTCSFPSCNSLAIRETGRNADLDHVEPHRADGTGGRTADDNLQVLCRFHHIAKHHLKWQVTIHEDGSRTWYSQATGDTFTTRSGD